LGTGRLASCRRPWTQQRAKCLPSSRSCLLIVMEQERGEGREGGRGGREGREEKGGGSLHIRVCVCVCEFVCGTDGPARAKHVEQHTRTHKHCEQKTRTCSKMRMRAKWRAGGVVRQTDTDTHTHTHTHTWRAGGVVRQTDRHTHIHTHTHTHMASKWSHQSCGPKYKCVSVCECVCVLCVCVCVCVCVCRWWHQSCGPRLWRCCSGTLLYVHYIYIIIGCGGVAAVLFYTYITYLS
jgi:hypothetical protein